MISCGLAACGFIYSNFLKINWAFNEPKSRTSVTANKKKNRIKKFKKRVILRLGIKQKKKTIFHYFLLRSTNTVCMCIVYT